MHFLSRLVLDRFPAITKVGFEPQSSRWGGGISGVRLLIYQLCVFPSLANVEIPQSVILFNSKQNNSEHSIMV